MPIGSGQKLCTVEIRMSPALTASMIPGSRLMRMPWLNSAYSKPRLRISSSKARPSVWRCEFQQVESEYIKKGQVHGRLEAHSTLGIRSVTNRHTGRLAWPQTGPASFCDAYVS